MCRSRAGSFLASLNLVYPCHGKAFATVMAGRGFFACPDARCPPRSRAGISPYLQAAGSWAADHPTKAKPKVRVTSPP